MHFMITIYYIIMFILTRFRFITVEANYNIVCSRNDSFVSFLY